MERDVVLWDNIATEIFRHAGTRHADTTNCKCCLYAPSLAEITNVRTKMPNGFMQLFNTDEQNLKLYT